MKRKNIFKRLAVVCLFVPLLSSCSDWLAVDMEDEIMEDNLYETNEGFLSSLNGIYTKMNEQYSSTLSMGVVDVMAQYYNVSMNSNHNFYVYANYNFNDNTFENMSDGVWTGLYFLIANLNTLLEHCDEGGAAISPSYYPIVKGEALALRAMFHFDLLRLYGPIYSAATENVQAIPYNETTSKDIQPLLSAGEVMNKVIRDLEDASSLLKNDPVRTKGVMDSDSENPNENADLRYRQYRLNYYAVQILLARAYLWMGNKDEAYEIATAIIKENEEKAVFPWTAKSAVQDVNSPDRLFSTEVVFGLYNLKRVNLYDSYFNSTVKISNSLTFVGTTMSDEEGKIPYFYSDVNDIRRGTNMWSEEQLEESTDTGMSTVNALCFNKYKDIPATSKSYRYMIPLIRMSEVYLIAAECAGTLTEAIGYVNRIREQRNCVNIELNASDTEESVRQYITDEFAREVIGEGQLYFYYKRHAMTEIMSGTSFSWWWGTMDNMDLQDYVWPLPKVEMDKRVTSN